MRALFFLNSLVGGGAERVCLNLAKQLYKFNIKSDFVTIYDRKADYDIPEYIQVFSLNIKNRTGEWIDVIKAVPRVNAFIADKEYILITAHVQPSHLLASLTKVKKKSFYVIHKSRHKAEEYSTWRERVFLRFFLGGKQVVTVSKGIEKELNVEYGISAENITTIYNPGGIAALKTEMEKPSPHNRPYILVMGRLVKQKNPLLALKMYYMGRFYENYDLIFLGKGDLEADLKRQVIFYGMQDHVFLKGFQKNQEQWLSNASLLLSCSDQEGLPMNLIEALGCGIPVVAADCPYGPNEILTDELAKYLIYPEKEPDKSIATIASALKEYPEITEKYYAKFEDELIAKIYLEQWKKKFG